MFNNTQKDSRMKSHMHIVIIAVLALSGCSSYRPMPNAAHLVPAFKDIPAGSPYGSVVSSNTQIIRDVNGVTQYRIRDGNVFTPLGARVARIDSSGNIFNTNGARVGRVSNK
jgi:hypothetical protein